jgi:hypothetical protein
VQSGNESTAGRISLLRRTAKIRLAIKTGAVSGPACKTRGDVAAAARNNDGVVIFAIKWIDTAGEARAHSMIAVRTLDGVRFADYGGGFTSSLNELASREDK